MTFFIETEINLSKIATIGDLIDQLDSIPVNPDSPYALYIDVDVDDSIIFSVSKKID